MMMKIYGRAFKVLMKKPVKLWALSLLGVLLTTVLTALCGVAIPVLGLAVTLLLGTSLTMVFLRGYRGEEVNAVQLFECFKDWKTIKRVLLGLGWMWLWIFLWSLIPLVGWIFALIRIYEYRLTPYILVFEPEVPITEAIKISARKTDGYKLQMWLADFVYALIFFVAVFILAMLAMIPVLGVLFALALFVLYIVFFALAPLFAGLVQAAFYEEINSISVQYCANCGAKMSTEASFCPNCGNPVNK